MPNCGSISSSSPLERLERRRVVERAADVEQRRSKSAQCSSSSGRRENFSIPSRAKAAVTSRRRGRPSRSRRRRSSSAGRRRAPGCRGPAGASAATGRRCRRRSPACRAAAVAVSPTSTVSGFCVDVSLIGFVQNVKRGNTRPRSRMPHSPCPAPVSRRWAARRGRRTCSAWPRGPSRRRCAPAASGTG